MNRADCRALRSAALELIDWAESIEINAMSEGDFQEGTTARRAYDKHLRLAKRLRAIAKSEQAKLPKKSVPLPE